MLRQHHGTGCKESGNARWIKAEYRGAGWNGVYKYPKSVPTDKAKELKEAYDSVSNEMGNIYYRDFTDKEILQFEEYLNRIRVNLEEWSDK